ncbi:phytanoyl-CoA dioxygenase family protein [Actibacterium sp. 188UL27-1]|uniref:phytanoyl-CoA dioxygenase family protein n=1 Tax=Actibacterium sp. 188UL27-1 TaxID=2786961 RepID=UPI001957B68C|nr:phytanoyl-CoA dioxygenase family protein [Actibacterium sp. 188UL27-1]MBM7068738.1 phytanoyl-CoA dioxygenase family protein [Actibacterium sp. 188UL27-1]
MTTAQLRHYFDRAGRIWLRNAVSRDELQEFRALAAADGTPGTRISASHDLARLVVRAGFSRQLAGLWPGMRPVRLVSFDKTADTNWALPWHQDRVIAVKGRAHVAGYSNWSCKSGIWHCAPPISVLQNMLFVRVHLDENTACNGAMDIALGSHRAGKVSADEAAQIAERHQTEITVAQPGDVLVLAMLTLHRSRPSRGSGARRVLRIDYAPSPLPAPLEWTL